MRAPSAILEELDRRDLVELARTCAELRGVTVAEIVGGSHRPAPTAARHAFWAALRAHHEAAFSWRVIARMWGCDVSTIRAGIRAHERRAPVVLAKVEPPKPPTAWRTPRCACACPEHVDEGPCPVRGCGHRLYQPARDAVIEPMENTG
jgi:hypothetical protein